MEIRTDSYQPSSTNNRVRHLRPELKCSLLVPRECDRGSLEHSGMGFSTLIARAPGNMAGPPVKCQEHDNSSEDIDNTAAVAYRFINKMGDAPSRDLCQLTLGMWNWCIDHQITISAEHLLGSQNQVPGKTLTLTLTLGLTLTLTLTLTLGQRLHKSPMPIPCMGCN